VITLALCIWMSASTVAPLAGAQTDVLVIEHQAAGLQYSFRNKPLDVQKPMRGIIDAIGDRSPSTIRVFVLVGDGVAIEQPYLIASVLGKIGGFKEVRYFHFSRHSGVMTEFKLESARWKMSFDGSLIPANR
jgi:hypothetical protein